MGFVRARLWAGARRGWRSWLGLALVAGVVWGGSIAAFAGARRTETAYDRFLEGTRRFDVFVPGRRAARTSPATTLRTE